MINMISDRLVFVSMSDTAGGAENILCMVAGVANNPLIFLKHVVNSRLVIPNGQKVTYLTQRGLLGGFLKLIKAVYPYRKNYTIISTHPYLNSFLGLLKRVGYIKSNVIVRECTSVFSNYKGVKKLSYQIAYKLGYPAVNLIVCQTELMRKQLLAQNKFIPSAKAVIIANPIDLHQIFKKADEPISKDLVETTFICTAGRLVSEKGFPILIRAFANIVREHDKLKLLILGEGKERSKLEALIKETGLEENILLMGHVDNPIPYYKQAKLCVVSSIKEGFPNVLLEMMTVNDAVISTLCAGGIENIPSILKVEPNNVKALTTAMEQALTTNHTGSRYRREDYLKDRSPAQFINSLMNEVQYLQL